MNLLHLQNIKLVIFDFDGTIADTSEGIIDAHKHTLKTMGRDIPSDNELRSIIGGNLLKTYIEKFGFEETIAREAVSIYRERYANIGIHKAELYPGFSDMLTVLKERGYKTGVATLKAEVFAKTMLNEMGILERFDEVCGMDPNDGLDKAGLILKCAALCGTSIDQTVLVGDSNNDLSGAQKAGVHFIGVTYGFGFVPEYNYEFITADCPKNISNLFPNLT